MKTANTLLLALALTAGFCTPAYADRYGHHHGHRHHHNHWGGVAASVVIGGLVGATIYHNTRPQPVIVAPPPVVVAPPPVYAAPNGGTWYFCASAGQYYPYVRYCPEGWQLVPPPQW